MIIKWNGHSCFTLQYGDYSLVIDPYTGVPGHEDIRVTANDVFSSHDHFDHNYTEGVELKEYAGEKPVTVRTLPCFHDECGGEKRGKNLIHIFEGEGMTAVHLGDLGHPLSDEQVSGIGPCDVLMIPVGGYYTIDGNQAFEIAGRIRPRVVIPMHYRHGACGFPEISGADIFLSNYSSDMIKEHDEPFIEVWQDTPSQVAVLGI